MPLSAPNQSVDLDGIDDFIKVNHHNSLNIYQKITIEAWIKPDSVGPEKTILIKGTSGQCVNYGMFIKDNMLAFVSGGDCGWKGASKKTIIQKGKWQHVAIVGTGKKLYFYLNGTLKDIIELYNTIGSVNSEALWIGKSSGILHNAFAGQLDEVRIWNFAKSKDQIKNQMYKELKGDENGLVLYLAFAEENPGLNNYSKLIIDKSKNKNDGLLYNYEKIKTTNLVKTIKPSIINTSQNYNEAIVKLNNHLFISTLEGLNITDGIFTKVYKQSTHNIKGNILQGSFHIDSDGFLWFTTHYALHRYMPSIDNFEIFQLPNSKGDTIDIDYSLIKTLEKDRILIKMQDELIVFDTKYKKIIKYFNITFLKSSKIDALIHDTYQVFVSGNVKELKITTKSNSALKNKIVNLNTESIFIDDRIIWVGTTNGFLVCFDLYLYKEIFRKKIDKSRIMNIQPINKNDLLITSKNQVYIYNKKSKTIIQDFLFKHPITQQNLNHLIKPYIDNDSILWIGDDGLGVFKFDLKPKKFQHWNNLTFDSRKCQTTQILESRDNNQYYVCSRSHGLSKLDSKGNVLKEFGNNHNSTAGIKFSTWINDTSILISNYYSFQQFDTKLEIFKPISLPFKTYGQVNHDVNNNTYGSVYENFLIKINIESNYQSFDTIAMCPPNINN
ncbi:MAG TPA: LamG domain-containing protein, partial [Bacteroidetes bacterium]|nr:LamG domain-containing protein [Bacteroidota bacterium]